MMRALAAKARLRARTRREAILLMALEHQQRRLDVLLRNRGHRVNDPVTLHLLRDMVAEMDADLERARSVSA